MAEAHDGSEEPPIALQVQGNIEVAVDIDGKEEASSPQDSALLVVSSGTRRRHNTSSPTQQVSIGVFIDDTTVKVEEEAPPPIPLAGGSQGDAELGGAVDVSQGDNQQDEQASQTHEGDAGGLAAQALMALIGKYFERVGPIIALIGLGTITSTIGGFFTRGPPALFVYFFTSNQHWDADDSILRDALVQRDAVILYYKCLPAFFVVGVLELCYGIWVSRNQPVRAGKRAKTTLILSAILLIVTVCFAGAGVNV